MTTFQLDMNNIYIYDGASRLGNTDWPERWVRSISEKLSRKVREMRGNAFYMHEMRQLLQDCIKVILSFNFLQQENNNHLGLSRSESFSPNATRRRCIQSVEIFTMEE